VVGSCNSQQYKLILIYEIEASEDIIYKITEFLERLPGGGRGVDRLTEKTPWVSTWLWEFKKCTLTPHFPGNIKPETLYKEYCITFLAQLDHHFV